jgi:hypothetical protein
VVRWCGEGYCEHRQIVRKEDLSMLVEVRHPDVSNANPLVIQKILSHLNTKNDKVVELLPQQS